MIVTTTHLREPKLQFADAAPLEPVGDIPFIRIKAIP